MVKEIEISIKDFSINASLLEDKNPKTCEEIWNLLPFEGKTSIYKEEVYFDLPKSIETEELTPNTESGDVSYWPQGPAFCIFYGDSQPVSSVSTFAKVENNIEKFREVGEGDKVTVRKADQ